MIETWTKFGKFKAANQMLRKNGWLSDLEILEIHQQIYRKTYQQTSNIVTETPNTKNPETPNQTLHDNNPSTANTQT